MNNISFSFVWIWIGKHILLSLNANGEWKIDAACTELDWEEKYTKFKNGLSELKQPKKSWRKNRRKKKLSTNWMKERKLKPNKF